MKLKLRSWESLKSDGFKEDWNICYIGDKKYPDLKFSRNIKDFYLGKSVTIKEVELDSIRDQIGFVGKNKIVWVPYQLFENYKQFEKIKSDVKHFKLMRDSDEAKYIKNFGFKFPCDFKELNKAQAIKLAVWILKVTK